MFIIILPTTERTLRERFATYEEARRRIDLFPSSNLAGMPLIFQELPDGSQRLVREDGKPLQWHRVPEEEDAPPAPETPIPVSEAVPDVGPPEVITWPPRDDEAASESSD
jgi:hypothetical protein